MGFATAADFKAIDLPDDGGATAILMVDFAPGIPNADGSRPMSKLAVWYVHRYSSVHPCRYI